jgi:hypothetical protein
LLTRRVTRSLTRSTSAVVAPDVEHPLKIVVEPAPIPQHRIV